MALLEFTAEQLQKTSAKATRACRGRRSRPTGIRSRPAIAAELFSRDGVGRRTAIMQLLRARPGFGLVHGTAWMAGRGVDEMQRVGRLGAQLHCHRLLLDAFIT